MLLITQLCSAQVAIRSVASGPWSSTATWAGGVIPQSGSVVELVDGHQVTINGQVSCASIELIPPPNNDKNYIKSELIIANGASLTAGSINLNSKTDRRYASLINNGALLTLNSLTIGKGSIVDNTAGTIAVSGAITNSGDIITNTATLKIGGTYSGDGIFTKGTGIVEFSGSASGGQSIANLAYHHLKLSGSNAKSSLAALGVSGNLQIEPGTTFKPGAYSHTITGDVINNGVIASETTQLSSITIGGDMINAGTTSAGAATYTVRGDWNNSGTFQAGTSTVNLQGNTLQQISGNNTFYNFQFSGTAKAELLQDISITKGVSISNSHLNTGVNTVWLGTNAALTSQETDAAHIIGTVRTSRTLTAASPEYFGNIGLTLTRNDIDPGVVTVERLTGVTTLITDSTESVTRQYNISRSGTNDISALSMNMELEFLPNELKSKSLNDYKLYNKGQNQEDAMPVPSVVVNQTKLQHSNSNRFGTYTLAPGPVPMPVELVWFKATRQDRVVVLQWKTASEQGNRGFEVQVSADGYTFKSIGFVPSKSPDSRIAQLYSFTDNTPARSELTYYRLKQVDFSGETSYSDAKAIKAAGIPFTFQALPNPFKEFIKFATDAASVKVTFTDIKGRLVLQQDLSVQDIDTDGYYRLSTNQLHTNGMYLLTVQTPDQVYTTKLLKQ